MTTFEKTIEGPITVRKAKTLCAMTGTLNSRKIGRHRRGTLLLIGGHGDQSGLTLKWAKAGQKCMKFVRCVIQGQIKRFQIYRFADHGKLLKVLKA